MKKFISAALGAAMPFLLSVTAFAGAPSPFEEFEEMVMMLAANEPSAPVEAGAIFSRLKSNCL